MSGIIIDDRTKAYFKQKEINRKSWLKWLKDTGHERTKLFKEALKRGQLKNNP